MAATTSKFRRLFIHEDTQSGWDATLYSRLRDDFYSKNGFTGRDTLVIGAGFGSEVPSHYAGTLLDLNPIAVAVAARNREFARAVQADACALPFPDGSFGVVVESLILSQLQLSRFGLGTDEAGLAHDEAVRVLAPGGRLFIIDTMSRAKTAVSSTRRGMEEHTNHKVYFTLREALRGGETFREMDSFTWQEREAKPFTAVLNPDMAPEGQHGIKYTVKIFEIFTG